MTIDNPTIANNPHWTIASPPTDNRQSTVSIVNQQSAPSIGNQQSALPIGHQQSALSIGSLQSATCNG
jgi:hypothetical protein